MKNKSVKKKKKNKKVKKSLFIVLGVIVLVCVLCLYLILNFDFEFSKKSEEKVLTKEELKELEVEKLRAALLNAGYVESESNSFKKVDAEKYKDDGRPLHMNIFYVYLDSLSYKQITFMDALNISMINEYSFLTNIATGTTTFFESGDSNQIEDVQKSSYDFNSGMGTCFSAVGYSCNANNLVDFKTSIAGFMASNKIDIELLKEV